MTHARSLMGMFLCLLTPSLVAAQQPRPGQDVALPQMYEDIEIMRRLLLREVHSRQMVQCAACHGPVGVRAVAFSPDGKLLATEEGVFRVWDASTGKMLQNPHGFLGPDLPALPGIDGVYLKGYGVVFSMTVPPQPLAGGWVLPETAPKPVSDWDKVRRQLRGEKTQSTGGGTGLKKEPRLDEVLLKLLADNGHHFSQLKDNEQLAIVVTFRSPEKKAGQTKTSAGLFGGRPLAAYDVSVRHQAAEALGQVGKPPSRARDYELMGDLHVRQGKLSEAIMSYNNALKAKPDGKEADRLYLKLSEIYLKMGEANATDAQRDAIRKAVEFLAKMQDELSQPAKGGQPGPGGLYAQLVISAPKKLLDRAGSGGINFGEFRQEASVEFRSLATSNKKTSGP
jgi:hypothetical protein